MRRDRGVLPRRHCEERSDEAIHSFFVRRNGLLRCARNDGLEAHWLFENQICLCRRCSRPRTRAGCHCRACRLRYQASAAWHRGPAKPWRRRDPAIHQSSRQVFSKAMDHRVKPGDDASWLHRDKFCSSRLSAVAANACMLPSRSVLPVSSVITDGTTPATAMQLWPAASP
jgi:hypothetical protein